MEYYDELPEGCDSEDLKRSEVLRRDKELGRTSEDLPGTNVSSHAELSVLVLCSWFVYLLLINSPIRLKI